MTSRLLQYARNRRLKQQEAQVAPVPPPEDSNLWTIEQIFWYFPLDAPVLCCGKQIATVESLVKEHIEGQRDKYRKMMIG